MSSVQFNMGTWVSNCLSCDIENDRVVSMVYKFEENNIDNGVNVNYFDQTCSIRSYLTRNF